MEAPVIPWPVSEQAFKNVRIEDSGQYRLVGKPVLPRTLLTEAVDKFVRNLGLSTHKPCATRPQEIWCNYGLYASGIWI